jgi:hypothetical protein
MARFLVIALALLMLGAAAPAQAPATLSTEPFGDWAAIVVAGDWRSHAGGDTQAFDNARRDVSTALLAIGFAPQNLKQYSLRPRHKGDDPLVVVQPRAVAEGFLDTAARAKGGCLFYLTSHGSPDGAVFGPESLLRPAMLDRLLDDACGTRPTVVVISACFSGVYVPPVSASNRVVLTAAREDRTSFGCSDKDRYPYFDDCMLQNLPKAADFLALGRMAQACVAKRETDEQLEPHSEPQLSVGGGAQLWAPLMRFKGR